MANGEHLATLRQGVEAWNAWRSEHQDIRLDLGGADLGQAKLCWANLYAANLLEADLRGANLNGANLNGANLREADLTEAKLGRANLTHALLVNTHLANADLTGCRVYGMSAWDLHLEGATQADLIITRNDQSEITVDDLEVAQFVYLLLNNQKIRNVIDTVTSKAVLILGRFTPERKAVLDALREELRRRDYLPILFDFERPAGQTITETVSLLAYMARFVVADITDAKSIPQELSIIVPDLPSAPVQPLLLEAAASTACLSTSDVTRGCCRRTSTPPRSG